MAAAAHRVGHPAAHRDEQRNSRFVLGDQREVRALQPHFVRTDQRVDLQSVDKSRGGRRHHFLLEARIPLFNRRLVQE
jgi:hypothetical protein